MCLLCVLTFPLYFWEISSFVSVGGNMLKSMMPLLAIWKKKFSNSENDINKNIIIWKGKKSLSYEQIHRKQRLSWQTLFHTLLSRNLCSLSKITVVTHRDGGKPVCPSLLLCTKKYKNLITYHHHTAYEVFSLKSSTFWIITSCTMLKVKWHVRETSSDFQWTTKTLHNHRCENFKSYVTSDISVTSRFHHNGEDWKLWSPPF
jgi:hypothetical protein